MTDRDDSLQSPLFPGAETEPGRPYTVLARKYRPKTFPELIGQDAMVRTLANAFATGRIAQAYMLTGVRGVGKTTTARLIARALNYEPFEGGGGPTVDMPVLGRHCAAILESRHLDVVEMDAASHTGIDDVRELIESAQYRPLTARTKVYIVDEVHMLSKAAFNGLLKTLEEPPPHVKFLFATTEIRKVPVTVLSRCQRFDLRRVDVDVLVPRLAEVAAAEGASAEPEALRLIARASEGSVRDALSILDQAIAHGGALVAEPDVRALLGLADRGRVFELLETVLRGDARGALAGIASLHDDGAEPAQILADLAEAAHQVTRCKIAGPESADPSLSEDETARARSLAERLAVPVLARAWQMLLKGHGEAVTAPDPRAASEMVLVRLAHVADWPTPGQMAGVSASTKAPASTPTPVGASRSASSDAPRSRRVGGRDDPDPARAEETEAAGPQPGSYEEVVLLADTQRDLKLKHALIEHVRLVRFAPGRIELVPTSAAAPNLAQEIGQKLSAWTGRRWMVAVSAEPGAPTLGEKRRSQQAKELEDIRAHPAVRDVLAHFPGAEIAEIRKLEPDTPDDDR